MGAMMQEQHPHVKLGVELRLGWASDHILQQAVHLPRTCQVSLLQLPSVCHDVTLEGLRCVLSFTHLVSLKMHLYGPCITDHVFRALSSLVNLRELCFGVLAHVSWVLSFISFSGGPPGGFERAGLPVSRGGTWGQADINMHTATNARKRAGFACDGGRRKSREFL